MSIRKRFIAAFTAILILLTLNLGISSWSNWRRSQAMEALRRALFRELLITNLQQKLSDIQKQVALMSQMAEAGAGGASPEQIAAIKRQLHDLHDDIHDLQRSRAESRSNDVTELSSFELAFHDLAGSWERFFENFGVNQTAAVTELATRAEPLAQQVVQEMAPHIKEEEQRQVEYERQHFYSVNSITRVVNLGIFSFSLLIAFGVAFSVLRYLGAEVGRLKEGTLIFASGNLKHRIELHSRDELGQLASAFNHMAGSLEEAQKDVTRTMGELQARKEQVEEQKRVADNLLLNILPAQVAAELQAKGSVAPRYFEDVTILFTDFKGFTLSTEELAAEELVSILDDYFTEFDRITSRYGLEKLKTIGDSYMCVGGLPQRKSSHPVDAVMAAFEMVKSVKDRERAGGKVSWAVRVGLHTGAVAAGVVGVKKFAFDVWGETVNFASRMESSGVPNRINMSQTTYLRVKDFIRCEPRGRVSTKEQREVEMYLAVDILPQLLNDTDDREIPPPAFLRRYRAYFQAEPPSFPEFLLPARQRAAAQSGVSSSDDNFGRASTVRTDHRNDRVPE